MDRSYFVYEDDISLIIPYPTSQSGKLYILIAPFKTEVRAFVVSVALLRSSRFV